MVLVDLIRFVFSFCVVPTLRIINIQNYQVGTSPLMEQGEGNDTEELCSFYLKSGNQVHAAELLK